MAILPGSLLIDRALAGEKFLEVATYTEEGVLHIIGGAVRVANDSARSRSAFDRNRSGRRIGRKRAIGGVDEYKAPARRSIKQLHPPTEGLARRRDTQQGADIVVGKGMLCGVVLRCCQGRALAGHLRARESEGIGIDHAAFRLVGAANLAFIHFDRASVGGYRGVVENDPPRLDRGWGAHAINGNDAVAKTGIDPVLGDVDRVVGGVAHRCRCGDGLSPTRYKSERNKAEEYQIFHDVAFVKVGVADAHNSRMHAS